MEVIAICRSKKKMRQKAASVLDRYLYRIDDRTWRGHASMECLGRISANLKKIASRNMAVALYRDGAGEVNQRPLFTVGSRSMFAADGRCPVSTHSSPQPSTKPAGEEGLLSLVEIAALFHDLGKASRMFQDKIRASLRGTASPPDAVRHEMISALVVSELLASDQATPCDVAGRMIEIASNPILIDEAWKRASDICLKVHRSGNPDVEVLTSRDEGCGVIGNPGSFRAQLILLILGHHRLPEGDHKAMTVTSGVHFNFGRSIAATDLDIAPGTPFWQDKWFRDRLRGAAERLSKSGFVPCHGLDVWARTALMSSDHIGSSMRQQGDGTDHIANTLENGLVPADSLLRHVQRVVRASRSLVTGALRKSWSCPSVSGDMAPEAILRPRLTGTRYDWQVHAAHAAADLVSTAAGGFFAALIAGTGAGKTRGAATILSAAALNDFEESRRGIRYNLALPLRTLASQSGREYIDELGFSQTDVTTMIGGHQANWIAGHAGSADPAEHTGSEDRFSEAPLIEDVDLDGLSLSLSALGQDLDRRLPLHLEMLCGAARGTPLERFLSTPILSATIDHFMPAASPERGYHLAATHRIMTSDLVIDEIDLLSEEDISAVKRLVRVAGLGGRRVVMMSATLSADVAQDFYEVYCHAYAISAEMNGVPPHVHFLCAGDAPGALSTSLTANSFAEGFSACKTVLGDALSAGPIIHMAEILPRARDWADQVDIIRRMAKVMHERHSVNIDGVRVSVGLVRMTRIKHLQSLCVALASEGDGCHYVIVHSGMPRLQRENIERELYKALCRKGESANAGLSVFLRRRCPQDMVVGQDIRIIVLASPVIETGNDVDFDWLITDPSSTRSIIHVAGRVNRHRRHEVQVPNVAILGDYVVSRQVVATSESGMMSGPGVETKPHHETGVRKLIIPGSRAMVDLIAENERFPVDIRLSDRTSGLPFFEGEIQGRYADVCREDLTSSLFWWTKTVATRHRFRRQEAPQVDAFPVPGEPISWGLFTGRYRKEFSRINVVMDTSSVFTGRNLFPETLNEIFELVSGIQEGRTVMTCPLSLPIASEMDVAKTFRVDPLLGRVNGGDEIQQILFNTLQI